MLEGIAIEIYKMIVIIWINQVVAIQTKNIGSGHVRAGQTYALGLKHLKNLLRIIIQVSPLFVAQVHRALPVSNHFYGILYPNSPMIGGDDQGLGDHNVHAFICGAQIRVLSQQ